MRKSLVNSTWIQSHLDSILFFALMCEVLSSTFWLQTFSIDVCRWIHFCSGGLIASLILMFHRHERCQSGVPRWLPIFLLCMMMIWVVSQLLLLFKSHSLDYTQADMLPVIQVMAQRLYLGQPVYEIIPEIWGGIIPVYLPGLWLPYVPAVILQIDLRWTGIVLLTVAMFFMFNRRKVNIQSLMVLLPVGLWFDYLLYNRIETFVYSEEAVVYAFYILFALSLYSQSYVWVGVLLACCLLSRYSIVFFAVALWVCIYLYEDRKIFKQLLIGAVATTVLLLTVGRAWTHLLDFAQLPNQYLNNLASNPDKYQDVMKEALGFVPWIGQDHYVWTYRIMITLLIAVACFTVRFYQKFRSPFYLLACLKLTLLIFYHFILIPYTYLFYTSVWVSVVIYFVYCNHSENFKHKFTV